MASEADDIKVSVFARTDAGMQRPRNEDAFLVADLTTGKIGLSPEVSTHRLGERGSLMVVSDGMGGAAAGEIASELAVKTLREQLTNLRPEVDICDQLKGATETANERIWNYAEHNRKLTGMGATLTAVLVHRTSAYIAQVGDSRAYLIRGDQVKQLTKDQSLVQALLDAGAIEPEQAHSIPQNVITQALGTNPNIEVAMASVQLCRNDYLVVFSDGLSNKVTAGEMHQVLEQSEDLAAACRRLVEMANERGGEDNITVIAARFDGESLHSAAQSNSITGSFKAIDNSCLTDSLTEISRQYISSISEKQESQPHEGVTTLVLQSPSPEAMGVQAPTAALNRDPRLTQVHPPSRKSLTVIAIIGLVSLLLLVIAYLIYQLAMK
jgi:serine/threonine protein phosphatase PrpC